MQTPLLPGSAGHEKPVGHRFVLPLPGKRYPVMWIAAKPAIRYFPLLPFPVTFEYTGTRRTLSLQVTTWLLQPLGTLLPGLSLARLPLRSETTQLVLSSQPKPPGRSPPDGPEWHEP